MQLELVVSKPGVDHLPYHFWSGIVSSTTIIISSSTVIITLCFCVSLSSSIVLVFWCRRRRISCLVGGSRVSDVVAAVGGNVSCIQILSSTGCNSRCHQLNRVMVVLVSPTISLLLRLGLLVVVFTSTGRTSCFVLHIVLMLVLLD
jgi:hypothetical protein